MRMPIRGIQIILIAAFFLSLLAWAMDINGYISNAAMFDYNANDRASYWGRKIADLAYTTFYLGEAALIEVLMRIWIATRERK